MKNVAANSRFWLAGTCVALAGVAVVRLVAPQLDGREAQVGCKVGGQLLALAGLAIIAFGVSRRVRRASDSTEA